MAEDLILNEDVNTVNSYCNIGINTFEEQTNLYEETMDDLGRKRIRDEENGGEWQQVVSHTKKKTKIMDSSESDFIQVCITGKNMLPKAFTLAKLFREQKILDVIKVKYINPYKINVSFSNESSAEKLIACEEFIKLEWRFQKSWEVGLSFGIIRNIDTELSEEEIIKNISCDFEIVVVKRLNRRFEKEWIPSDTVKIGFKGSNLPGYIYILDLRVKVEQQAVQGISRGIEAVCVKILNCPQINNIYSIYCPNGINTVQRDWEYLFSLAENLFLDPIGLLNSLELWLSAELLLEIFDAIPHLEI
ncbi:unnamed protein product, partial [Brenthis ino]